VYTALKGRDTHFLTASRRARSWSTRAMKFLMLQAVRQESSSRGMKDQKPATGSGVNAMHAFSRQACLWEHTAAFYMH
jgi:hypothetical protein